MCNISKRCFFYFSALCAHTPLLQVACSMYTVHACLSQILGLTPELENGGPCGGWVCALSNLHSFGATMLFGSGGPKAPIKRQDQFAMHVLCPPCYSVPQKFLRPLPVQFVLKRARSGQNLLIVDRVSAKTSMGQQWLLKLELEQALSRMAMNFGLCNGALQYSK